MNTARNNSIMAADGGHTARRAGVRVASQLLCAIRGVNLLVLAMLLIPTTANAADPPAYRMSGAEKKFLTVKLGTVTNGTAVGFWAFSGLVAQNSHRPGQVFVDRRPEFSSCHGIGQSE